ncbi:MAG: hypothetical protein EKE20_15570 [Candidatus Symbiopectobacterium sp. Dall1.0]|nr:hypothetical protein [Candidatus Symbiopectobacterium sp. Dall1.0]
MTHSVEHQRTHTKMVKQAFKAVFSQTGIPYPTVFQRFVDAEPECNELVWEAFYHLFPDSPYHYVAFCHDCRSFDLYETGRDMLRDGPVW